MAGDGPTMGSRRVASRSGEDRGGVSSPRAPFGGFGGPFAGPSWATLWPSGPCFWFLRGLLAWTFELVGQSSDNHAATAVLHENMRKSDLCKVGG